MADARHCSWKSGTHLSHPSDDICHQLISAISVGVLVLLRSGGAYQIITFALKCLHFDQRLTTTGTLAKVFFDELAQQSQKFTFRPLSGHVQPNLHLNSELMTLFVTLILEADDLELDGKLEKTVFHPTAPH